jgi:hypothetical protein
MEILWHTIESDWEHGRIHRLNHIIHGIFFNWQQICTNTHTHIRHGFMFCTLCEASTSIAGRPLEHGTPRFLQSLDASQFVIECGKFDEIEEHYFEHGNHGAGNDCKIYQCIVYKNGNEYPVIVTSIKRQEARYIACLAALGHIVTLEEKKE